MPGLGRSRGADDPLTQAMRVPRRGRLHLRARHQLRPDLRALPPRRRAGVGDHAGSSRSPGPSRPRRGGLLRHVPQHLVRRRRGGRHDAVPGAQVQARAGAGDRRRDRSQIDPADGPNRDTEFFWDGTRAGELRIQKCNACGALRFPPGPVCPSCDAMDRGYVVAGGRGTVFSYVVHHAPPVPGRELPIMIALVDLDEGVRMSWPTCAATRGPRDRRPRRLRVDSTGSTTT